MAGHLQNNGGEMKFRKKPVVIEAWQWMGETLSDAHKFVEENSLPLTPCLGRHEGMTGFIIPTLEGSHVATKSDWIIKGVAGEFYPCKNDIFLKTYEAAE